MATRKERQKLKRRAALAKDRDYGEEVKRLKQDNEGIIKMLETREKELEVSKKIIGRLRVIQRCLF